jgi:undecaprenyl-diphosphatase
MRVRLTPEKWIAVYAIAGALSLVASAWLFGWIARDAINDAAFLGGVDQRVATWLHARTTPELTKAMLFISYFGAPLVTLLVGLASVITLWRRRQHDAVLAVLLAVPCGVLLNVLLKYAVQRQRPAFVDPIVTLTTYSFPSGHALGATVLYGVLAAVVFWSVPDARWRALAIVAAAAFIALVCFSRLYLGAHYLSDVIAGFVAGLLWLAVCLVAVTVFRRRKTHNDG